MTSASRSAHHVRVMRSLSAWAVCAGLGLACMAQGHAESASACPVTIGSDSLGLPFPESEAWYGSESLAVMLPEDGQWQVTAPDAQIAVKLFVWSIGFKPGMERNLSVRVEPVAGGANDAKVRGVTNAEAESLGGWTMLVGIDFPSAGCWRLALDYLGQSLSFVVETTEPAAAVATAG